LDTSDVVGLLVMAGRENGIEKNRKSLGKAMRNAASCENTRVDLGHWKGSHWMGHLIAAVIIFVL